MDEHEKQRIVFMGTPAFALESLKALHEAGHKICAVVTQPDKPQGRGNLIVFSPVKRFAVEHGITVMQPNRPEEVLKELRVLSPDFIVVVAYGRILKKPVLDLPKRGCINVHASLLPLYRGASPIQCALINGEPETGVTTMLMDEGMDTGPILLQDTIAIHAHDNAETLTATLAEMGAALIVRTIAEFDAITPQPQPVCEGAACAPILCKGHGAIDWTKPAGEIHNLVRGCYCWPSAFTRFGEERIIVWAGKPLDAQPPPDTEPGTIIAISPENGIETAAGQGVFAITELQRAGKKRQGFEEFLRGFKLQPGDAFTSVPQ